MQKTSNAVEDTSTLPSQSLAETVSLIESGKQSLEQALACKIIYRDGIYGSDDSDRGTLEISLEKIDSRIYLLSIRAYTYNLMLLRKEEEIELDIESTRVLEELIIEARNEVWEALA